LCQKHPRKAFSKRPMTTPREFRRDHASSLVIILAFVVLLTVLVLAYFSYSSLQRQISQASVNQAAAELFAKGTVNTLIGDLRQEILAGSTNISTNASHPVYYPTTAATMVPALAGFTTNAGLENLVKVSRTGSAFFSGTNYATATHVPANRAAALSTTNASQNGRFFSLDRWNSHLLLAKANTNSATDLTPTNTFTAPDWIFVSRDGSNPTAWNNTLRWSTTEASTVVGRYAYAIYDEGGLLDMNAAGFPPGSDTNLVAGKGGLATADLSVIPGLTAEAISALVGWRNFVTAGATGGFPNYTFSSAAQTNYFDFARTNTAGFLRTANTALSSGQSDKMFVSRQQLIQFLTQGVAANDTQRAALQNALRYLGTFSRDLEQPSFRPDPNRPKNTGAQLKMSTSPASASAAAGFGGNDAYDNTAPFLQDTINPPFLAVHDSTGEPVVKRRFPLARIATVTPALATSHAADIKNWFGLTWDAGNTRWNYTSPDGASATFRIKTLDEVAGAGREPDFFETLKAAIESGSLGKQHGGNENVGAETRFTAGDPAVDGYIDFQIFQIGANLIDQYDADSHPTTIHSTAGASGDTRPARNTSGVENIPYLYGWMSAWYRTRQLDIASDVAPDYRPVSGNKVLAGTPDFAGKKLFETATLIQPILWNPHAPFTESSPPDVPTNFRVVAGAVSPSGALVPVSNFPTIRSTGANPGAWWDGFDSSQSASPPEFPFDGFSNPQPYIQSVIDPSTDWITFNTTSTGKAAFREPYRIQSPNYPPGSNAAGYAEGTITPINAQELNDPTQPDTLIGTAIGFYTGRTWTGPTTAGNAPHSYLNLGAIRYGLRMELQYKNPYGSSPEYLTYDVIDYAYAGGSLSSTGNLAIVDNDDATSSNRGLKTGIRADPRTNRWGLPTFRSSPHWSAGTLSTSPSVFPKDANSSFDAFPIYPFAQGTTISPAGTSASALFYRQIGDNAGGVPKASGWRFPGGSTLPQGYSDLAVNLSTGSTTSSIPGGKSYYTDPDGVLRRASGAYFTSGSADGLPLATGNDNSRPFLLNRPFRSVAEMGYAFRGIAWKDLDFFTPESGDSALLDAFCLNELDNAPDKVAVAGRVSLNSRQPAVLETLISGASKAEGGVLSSQEARRAADALTAWTADITSNLSGVLTKGPLRNRGELVGKFVSDSGAMLPAGGGGQINRADVTNYDGSKAYSGYSSMLTAGSGGVFSTAADASVKRRRESVMRALVDAGNTRTWNLLIDLVAQVGRYPSHATSLNQFVVEGETRFWVHLALDRFTGKIVDIQTEIITE
jgi:hypothetical protein